MIVLIVLCAIFPAHSKLSRQCSGRRPADAPRWTRADLMLRRAIRTELAQVQHRLLPPGSVEDVEGRGHLHRHLQGSLKCPHRAGYIRRPYVAFHASVRSHTGLQAIPICRPDDFVGTTKVRMQAASRAPYCIDAPRRRGQLAHRGMSSKYRPPGTGSCTRQAAGTTHHVSSVSKQPF